MILSLLFDMPFKDWFVGVYMHDLVPMLTDTMNALLADEQIQPLLKSMKDLEESIKERKARASEFAHVLALTNLRRQIARQRHLERRREERRQNGEVREQEENEDDDEANIDEEADDIVIPDNETTRMELQAMEAQILHRRNEEGE